MQTILEDMRSGISEEGIRLGGEILKQGGLVAFPTETVYGLGGNALDAEASAKIYAAKGRPSDNPLIVHIADWEAIRAIVSEVPEAAKRLADAFWPGPLTMILNKSDLVPYATTGGLETVAVRMPVNPIARALIRAGGGYVAAPSANTSGRPSPTKAEHVAEDLNGKIDMIIDGGTVDIGLESTIVDLTDGAPTILRPGYINQEMLTKVLGEVEMDRGLIAPESGVHPKAPGMKYRHYAPKAPVTVVAGEPKKAAEYIAAHAAPEDGVICFDEFKDLFTRDCETRPVMDLGPAGDKGEQARHIFDALRAFDHTAVTAIWAQCPDTDGIGLAIANRLNKAAGFHIIRV